MSIADTTGILDPANAAGPYYGWIEPQLQALICRYDPVLDTWHERFRGFVDDFDYAFDPSQKVNRLELTLTDIFEFLSAIEMFPGDPGFGVDPPVKLQAADQVYYPPERMDVRIIHVLDDAIGPIARDDYAVVFSGNVNVKEQVYTPGESAMTAIQEAADAEFPGVSNVYTDRTGRLAVHGRQAKFDPVGVHAGAAAGAWDWHRWTIGDGAAVSVSPASTVQIRRFAFNRGRSKIINQGIATPHRTSDQLTPAEMRGQVVIDSGSINHYGIRSWSAQDLLTDYGIADATGDLAETHKFAEYYVGNYAWPRNRITDVGFRSMRPESPGAGALWRFLSLVDISDEITNVYVASPGGGAFESEPYFVEGVHEDVRPLGVAYDDVTLSLDLSPRAYFNTDPWG